MASWVNARFWPSPRRAAPGRGRPRSDSAGGTSSGRAAAPPLQHVCVRVCPCVCVSYACALYAMRAHGKHCHPTSHRTDVRA